MACQGTKTNGHKCGETIYRCNKCGAVGCQNDCRNQNFKQGTASCLKCGSQNKSSI